MNTQFLAVSIALGAGLLVSAAAAQPVVGVNAFAGSGPNGHLGKGLAEMLISDLFTNKTFQKCNGTLVEMMKRPEILEEIRLCHERPEFDKASCARQGMLLDPTALVDGTVTTTEDSITWSLQMRDPATGKVIGGSKGSASGDEVSQASAKIADQLARQACRDGMDYSSPPVATPSAGPKSSTSAPPPPPPGKPAEARKVLDEAVNAVRGLKGLFGR
jgi:hypothetical protein